MKDNLSEELRKMSVFIRAASEAIKDQSTSDFDCPLCGEKAYASKAPTNGHIHAYCSKCDANFYE